MAERSHRALPLVSLSLALACALGVSACTQGGVVLGRRPSGVIQPNIKPDTAVGGSVPVTRSFPFDGGTVRLTVPVSRAVYAGSKSAQKSEIFLGGARPKDWVPDYYRAFVSEKHQAAFYASTLAALRQARQQEGLDDSRYVELITSMGQSLTYNTDPGALAPKFPIETFGDGYGDCDDKTLLAASLLSREGFDVSILLFQPEKHIALGIKAPGLDYKNTGYAYVEMTEPSFVGIPTETLAGGVKLTSQPVVIKIGSGTKSYDAGAQIAYIKSRLDQVASALKQLRARTSTLQTEIDAEATSIQAERNAAQTVSDPAAQQVAIQNYNAHVAAYNARVKDLNALIAKYNAIAEVERYAATHQTSRPQVYAKLQSAQL